jgi:hypothetical protein
MHSCTHIKARDGTASAAAALCSVWLQGRFFHSALALPGKSSRFALVRCWCHCLLECTCMACCGECPYITRGYTSEVLSNTVSMNVKTLPIDVVFAQLLLGNIYMRNIMFLPDAPPLPAADGSCLVFGGGFPTRVLAAHCALCSISQCTPLTVFTAAIARV